MEEAPTLKCRLRIGAAEIELESSGKVDDRITDKILELMDIFEDQVTSCGPEGPSIEEAEAEQPQDEEAESGKEKKKDGRGGKRQPFISKGLNELEKKGKLVNVTAAEVNAQLKELYAVHVEDRTVYRSLQRRLGKSLTRTGTTLQDSRFTFIGAKEPPKGEESPLSGS